ncbi:MULTISPECIES: hypothetical protein [unclassified Lentimonas]|nr:MULTISPECIES: hypothetical protein [unclassified Lentimonas]CAA6678039.1 Unannotated [Lentimonas sp. CC4]CAA6687013.1 Unannotated [Lentimonas sp. CC6]CAA7075856.1 Unannotated [Lentimonas sp. CC4]CAA7172018.1 Unannotated [Lentimonas sp. CC21]CAA7182919.1 Unannotated [Lentimonas sp. CC8]
MMLIDPIALTILAYIGPGIGSGTLGIILGIILSFFMAILALVWYPVKRLIKKRGSKGVKKVGNEAVNGEVPTEDSSSKID